MSETPALAPLPRRTLDGWHRFSWRNILCFARPFVQSPIPGRPAALLVLSPLAIPKSCGRSPRWNLPPISANGS